LPSGRKITGLTRSKRKNNGKLTTPKPDPAQRNKTAGNREVEKEPDDNTGLTEKG